MKRFALPALAALALAAPAAAQQNPEAHYLTVGTFRVPLGEDRGKVLEYLEKYMMPMNRLNPKVLSARMGMHNYGPNASDMIIMLEFADWADITAPCDPCQRAAEAAEPKAGTPERKAYDELLAVWLKYYSGHMDNIYVVPAALIK